MFGGEGTVASTEGIGSVAAQVSSPSWFGSAPASQADYAPSTKSAYVPPSQADRSQADNKSELLAIQNNSLQHLDIIRHFSLSLTADDPDKALTQIRDITNNNDGTVISSEVSLYGNTYYVGSMDISVPEEKVNDVIDAIQRLNVAFEVENITTEEVTSQHMDLEANINLNQVVQAQYVDLLNQAKGVDDVLQLTDTVANVQAQIQALTANLSQLTKDIHYVKIHISVNPVIIIAVQASGWMIYDTFLQATDTLVAALECLAELSIWFVIYLCPLMLLVTILFYLFRPISRKVSVYYGSFRKNNDND